MDLSDLWPERLVAEALVVVPLQVDELVDALLRLCARRTARARAVARELAVELVETFGEGRRLLRDELEEHFDDSRTFQRGFAERTLRFEAQPPRMRPSRAAAAASPVPSLTTTGELAAWLGLHDDELSALTRTFARDRVAPPPRAGHYHREWRARRSSPPRLIEAPKATLKDAQRRVARHILQHVPPHDAAHGFVRGRGVRSGVAPHAGQVCVLRLDLEDCFASIGRGRVLRTFLELGYPEEVADQLARLCTTATPRRALAELARHGDDERAARLRHKLEVPHLPQGAPSSPALANLCMFRSDARLAGLARRFGASYTRYADDLLFSGGDAFRRDARRCAVYAAAILLRDGMHVAHRKTRVQHRSQAQRACGLVLNERPQLPRRERERLEAILHNCAQHGPSTQNREGVADFRAHLRGRLEHALQFGGGDRLRRWFDAIDWSR